MLGSLIEVTRRNLDRQNLDRQNLDRQNLERQNLDRQNLERSNPQDSGVGGRGHWSQPPLWILKGEGCCSAEIYGGHAPLNY